MFAVISVVISLLHHRDQPQAVDVKRQHEGEELSIYRDLVLAGVSTEYQEAMLRFPVH
jgi:hypothetical protein